MLVSICLTSCMFVLLRHGGEDDYRPTMDRETFSSFLSAFELDATPSVKDANLLIHLDEVVAFISMRIALSQSEYQKLLAHTWMHAHRVESGDLDDLMPIVPVAWWDVLPLQTGDATFMMHLHEEPGRGYVIAVSRTIDADTVDVYFRALRCLRHIDGRVIEKMEEGTMHPIGRIVQRRNKVYELQGIWFLKTPTH